MNNNDEILEICKRADINFDNLKKDVELTEEVKNKLSKEEIEKVQNYIRTEKLISYLDEKIEELEKEK